MKQIIAAAILGSLILLGGCVEDPTLPDSLGYDGLVQTGWDQYQAGNYASSLEYFLDAIDADPTAPDAYVGAGWASLYLPDVWRIADEYFYMAAQQQVGEYPLAYYTENMVQDTMWTNFQCVHPDLPPSVLDPILEQTGTQGIVWVGEQIHAIVGSDDLPFRFQPMNSVAIAMFEADNSYTTAVAEVDSIVGGWVYLTMPLVVMEIGDDDYYDWIGVGDQMNYEYRVFDMGGASGGQMMLDAFAGSVMLQDIRETGDALLGCASAFALDQVDPEYSFGAGQYYQGMELLSNMQVKGTAASLAFVDQYFLFSWFTCVSEGMGTELDPESAGFVTDLMSVIELMLAS